MSACLRITDSHHPIRIRTFVCLRSETERNRTNRQTMVYKRPHRKLTIEQYKPNEKLWLTQVLITRI